MKLSARISDDGTVVLTLLPDLMNSEDSSGAQIAATICAEFLTFISKIRSEFFARVTNIAQEGATVRAKFDSRRNAKEEIRGMCSRLSHFHGIHCPLDFEEL